MKDIVQVIWWIFLAMMGVVGVYVSRYIEPFTYEMSLIEVLFSFGQMIALFMYACFLFGAFCDGSVAIINYFDRRNALLMPATDEPVLQKRKPKPRN